MLERDEVGVEYGVGVGSVVGVGLGSDVGVGIGSVVGVDTGSAVGVGTGSAVGVGIGSVVGVGIGSDAPAWWLVSPMFLTVINTNDIISKKHILTLITNSLQNLY